MCTCQLCLTGLCKTTTVNIMIIVGSLCRRAFMDEFVIMLLVEPPRPNAAVFGLSVPGVHAARVRLYLSQQSSSGRHWRRARSWRWWRGLASRLPGRRSGTGANTRSPADKHTTNAKEFVIRYIFRDGWLSL